ncbi:HisA/HisF-related TIM barrel protein [Thalassoglobus polymorphus]|uniref:1-(5-phosphoribosyl)-5-[(5-phosphoribosylamino)methylideneamino] imidazole-4-carboxamide isomerase n=1 Tax=Thalassoglobus polymorphus TaxID=2527994 RepID=A0A517QNW8_9PLAN|nr:HisA/HisF-related TIM barrel protein [Thalassoglobus polymorphus]QDT33348.1 1-(5-phosphoribosyl)-5-[(5-phosphoribosylamino)methylideneamino] imidazole-4-carboxamide isomerase [Thalassoglobus polymorphus]
MELIPVLDLMRHQVVRGIAGNRKEYQANQSCLVEGSDPVETALAFKKHFNVKTLYIADLDALTGHGKSTAEISSLSKTGHNLIVDAGAVTPQAAVDLLKCGANQVVVPLEALPNMKALSTVLSEIGPLQTVFSLDLKNGKPLEKRDQSRPPLEIVNEAIAIGVQKMIVLDIAGVGTSRGISTVELCQQIRSAYPDVEIISGGGVRSLSDLTPLTECHVNGVLIASALHDGQITPAQWMQFQQRK